MPKEEDTIRFFCECVDTEINALNGATVELTFGISPWESKLVEHKFKMLTTNDHEIAYLTNEALNLSSGKTYNLFDHCCISYRLTDEGRPGWKNLIVAIPKRLERLWYRKLSEIRTSEKELDFFAELAANSSIEF